MCWPRQEKEEEKEETNPDKDLLFRTHHSIIRTFNATTDRYSKILKPPHVSKMYTTTIFYGTLVDSSTSVEDMQKILREWKVEVAEKICFNEANHMQTKEDTVTNETTS